MKAGIRILLMTAVFIVLAGGMAFADSAVNLQLDGQIVQTDVAPIIENGRTLVPYRALLESMGAEVSWEQSADMATAILGNHRVQVTIDRTTAFVNGMTKEMDVPPRIINGRTMIPLRFVLENLNCQVVWDENTRTVSIASPKTEGTARVHEIAWEETDNSYRIIARGSGMITSARTFAYIDPERYGIDIDNAVFPDQVGSIAADNEIFSSVRFSQFDADTVRIVVDLNDRVAGKVSLSEDRSEVYIDFAKPGFPESPGVNRGNRGENDPVDSDDPVDGNDPDEPGERDHLPAGVLPQLDWRAAGKLIAIDVGHGGNDPGASGKINGKVIITEKELNLAIALRLHELLDQAGANAVLLRDRDVSMSLYSRPEAANAMNADLLVSIHNNSAETSTPSGAEVLYYDNVGLEAYGMTSRELAACIQKELIAETGMRDRGIINAPHLAVLNKSLMPAVIIEGGFLSNQGDLQVMLTEGFKEAYATAAARGIINALNTWAER